MVRQEEIAETLDYQKKAFKPRKDSVLREKLNEVPCIDSYASIITGMRRCGKSTLLLQLHANSTQNTIYLNFEDIRLAGFETADFVRLHAELLKRKVEVIVFDEIQLIKKWEIYVHQLLREGYKVFVTGSNATLLSQELGTHLTGRQLSMEMFPFSYKEFLTCKKLEANPKSLLHYLKIGGIPEYVKSENGLVIKSLIDDILIRDIAVRYAIRDSDTLRQLAVYLMSNIGTPISANKLSGNYNIKSTSTLLEYFSHMKNTYLIDFLPQFSYSLKAQVRNPKKVYAMDMGLVNEASLSFSDDYGRKLENLIFIALRNKYKELYFFKEKGECDFVVYNNGKAEQLIQVCAKIDDFNFEREYNGLLEAMKFFNIKEGKIITLNQEDSFSKDGYEIRMMAAYKYLSEE